MVAPGRKYSSANGYRYGFNGKEQDKETSSTTTYDYGFRIYNPTIGRFLSVDPLQNKYPELTAYQFSHNAPIDGVDLDGRERYDARLIKNEDGTCKLEIISTGPESKRYSNSFWKVTKIPPYIRLEYNGQHYIFADGRNRNKIPEREVFVAPINYMQDYNSFIVNPNPDAYISEEEANDGLMSELVARTIVGLAEETSNRVIGKISNRVQWRGRYTNKNTNNQAKSVHNGNPEAEQSNTAESNLPIPGQQIIAKRTDPQTGFSSQGKEFRGTGYKLENGQFHARGKGMSGTYDFVITKDGRLLLGHGHYFLSKEAPTVQAAGTIKMYNGKVKEITNNSGHYQPSAAETGNFQSILTNAGVDVSGAKVKTEVHN